MQLIIQSAPYAIGLLAAFMLLAIMVAVFDSKQFTNTFRAYWIHSGIWSALAWAILFILRGGK